MKTIEMWTKLKNDYEAFEKQQDIDENAGYPRNHFFYPEDGKHPVYGIYISYINRQKLYHFIFEVENYGALKYQITPDIDNELLLTGNITFTHKNETISIDKDPISEYFWLTHFESEADEEWKEYQKLDKMTPEEIYEQVTLREIANNPGFYVDHKPPH